MIHKHKISKSSVGAALTGGRQKTNVVFTPLCAVDMSKELISLLVPLQSVGSFFTSEPQPSEAVGCLRYDCVTEANFLYLALNQDASWLEKLKRIMLAFGQQVFGKQIHVPSPARILILN